LPCGLEFIIDQRMQNFPSSGEWAVCHVRPRCEKKLASFCDDENIGCFLPLLNKKKLYGSRVREHTTPLFSSYLFVRADNIFSTKLPQNNYCVRLLKVTDQALFNQHMNAIYLTLQSEALLELTPYIKEGKQVLITQGPFKGIKGIVSKIENKEHILINIELLQQAVSIKADWSILTPIE